MATMWTTNYAFEQFMKNIGTIKAAESTNEATTRMRAIDTIMFDVLGWDKLRVECERYCRAEGFTDYAFRDDRSFCLVLEAKRQGDTFLLPSQQYPDSPIGFPLLAHECPAVEKAMLQALGYAASVGTRYIAITNGHQWLITLTFVQDQPIGDRSVFVFESLEAIQSKFRTFWDCFSPDGINSNRAANALVESRKAPAPPKLSSRIHNYPVPAERNFIANELSTVVTAVLDEVRHDEDETAFLTECYIEPEATASSVAQATEIVHQRLSADEQIHQRSVDPQNVPQLLAQYVPEKPIVVLGGVGHGKTTFLKYLRHVKAKKALDKYIQIDINFIDRPDEASEVGRFVYAECERQLCEKYEIDITKDNIVRGVLHFDIERFRNSPEGKAFTKGSPEFVREELAFIKSIRDDKHVYLGKVFQHLRSGREFSLAIFFDNLDRRLDPIQEAAFLRASAMARDWVCLVFVCLRPGTYYRSKVFGVLDSVAPRVVNIVSPRTRPLVQRRLLYARRIADGTSSVPRKGVLSSEITFQLPNTADFLDCCAISFDRSKDLAPLFEAVSNGNARDLLGYVSQVLTSLHLDTAKILDRYRSPRGYQMPVHEALRAMLFGGSIHYDPTRSVFVNLYDIERADLLEHFSRFLTLHHLCAVSNDHPHYGYIERSHIERYLCQVGFTEEHAVGTIRFLFDRQCCESKIPGEEWSDHIVTLRVTSRGRYHVCSLTNTFNYMDAITIDTPILDYDIRQQINDVFPIRQRLDRAEVFIEYLNRCSRVLQDSTAKQLWDATYSAVIKDIQEIRAHL